MAPKLDARSSGHFPGRARSSEGHNKNPSLTRSLMLSSEGLGLGREENWCFGPWSHALEHNHHDPQGLISEDREIVSVVFPAFLPAGDHIVCLDHHCFSHSAPNGDGVGKAL